jgi:hypothetical protein
VSGNQLPNDDRHGDRHRVAIVLSMSYSVHKLVTRKFGTVAQFLTRQSSGGHQAKRRKEEKPKPEEQEGMPQHQHCPPMYVKSVAEIGIQ